MQQLLKVLNAREFVGKWAKRAMLAACVGIMMSACGTAAAADAKTTYDVHNTTTTTATHVVIDVGDCYTTPGCSYGQDSQVGVSDKYTGNTAGYAVGTYDEGKDANGDGLSGTIKDSYAGGHDSECAVVAVNNATSSGVLAAYSKLVGKDYADQDIVSISNVNDGDNVGFGYYATSAATPGSANTGETNTTKAKADTEKGYVLTYADVEYTSAYANAKQTNVALNELGTVINTKQDKLEAGKGIVIEGNTIKLNDDINVATINTTGNVTVGDDLVANGKIIIGDLANEGANVGVIGEKSAIIASTTKNGVKNSAVDNAAVIASDGGQALGKYSFVAASDPVYSTGEFSTILASEGSGEDAENGTTVASGQHSAILASKDSKATGDYSVVLAGTNAVASGDYSLAVGNGAQATANNSIALGNGAVADEENTVSVGSAGNEHRITNVANGTKATDAVNLRQLENEIRERKEAIAKVGANAAAMASIAYQPMRPGESQLAIGTGNYKSKTAVAAGLAYQLNNRLMVNAKIATGNGENMVGMGLSYRFGGHDVRKVAEENVPGQMTLEQVEMKAAMESQNFKMNEALTQVNAENAELKERLAKLEAIILKNK